jgi:hypothetical protein
MIGCPPICVGRCPLDRFHNILVAGAAAEIPLDTKSDLLLRGRRIALEQLASHHYDASRAIPALEAMLTPESFLERVERTIVRETLDRSHFVTFDPHREDGTGLYRSPVQQNRASTAARGIAAHVGPSEP